MRFLYKGFVGLPSCFLCLGITVLSCGISTPVAAEGSSSVQGLPPAPTWRGGTIHRNRDGQITLDPRRIDPLTDVTKGRRVASIGTGFFVSETGHVATNRHVVNDCALVTLEDTRGRRAEAAIAAIHPDIDLALLTTTLNPRRWAIFDTLGPRKPAEPLTTVGYPTRTLPPVSPRVTHLHFAERATRGRLYLFEGDVYPGNSGGPLVNRVGHVVGVVTATINKPEVYKRTGKRIKGMGLAVSAEATYRFLNGNGAKPSSRSGPPTDMDGVPGQSGSTIVVKISCWR